VRILLAVVATGLLLSGCLSASHKSSPAGGAGPSDCLATVAGIDLQSASIPELQAALAAGRVTSVQLVEAYLARIAAFDDPNATHGPKLNSIRHLSPNALREAQEADAERAAGHVRGPLHGIPILLKDNVGTTDEPTTAGSIALAANVPRHNATLTDQLRAAGAVILGKTNLSEFAQWISLRNPNGYSSLGGQVVNAYTGGDPSGSSSGSGVAGSMAFAAATIGSETQGSILGPSDANSLVGVKPTVGLVSRAGVIPLAASFDTPGPMGRSVTDVALVLGAIAGPDPRDAATAASASHLPAGNDFTATLKADALKGARLGYDPSDRNALFAAAREDLAKAGAVLVPVDPSMGQATGAAGPEGQDSTGASELALLFNEFKAGINGYLATEAGPGLPVSDLTGIIQYNNAHPDRAKYGQDLLIASDASPGVAAAEGPAALPLIEAQRARIDGLLQQDRLDALVGPGLAYYQGGAEAGYPTVIVPMGYTQHTPLGLSFFGTAWSEPKLLGYAYAFEQATHARRPPPAVTPTLLDGVCGGATAASAGPAAARAD